MTLISLSGDGSSCDLFYFPFARRVGISLRGFTDLRLAEPAVKAAFLDLHAVRIVESQIPLKYVSSLLRFDEEVESAQAKVVIVLRSPGRRTLKRRRVSPAATTASIELLVSSFCSSVWSYFAARRAEPGSGRRRAGESYFSPVSCHRMSDTGIMPAPFTSSKNPRRVNRSPSCCARSRISSSMRALPVT